MPGAVNTGATTWTRYPDHTFGVDPHEDFIDEEGIAEALVSTFQAAGIYGSELDTPETDCFAGDSDAAFCQKVFDISMAEIEAVIQPDGVTNDVRWDRWRLDVFIQ